MFKPGIYVGEFVDAHAHLLGDCVKQYLTASVFISEFQITRLETGLFQLQIDLVSRSRGTMYSVLLGDLRERFENLLCHCQLVKAEHE